MRNLQMNWYSKRTLLAGVYTSTELYMTQDKSQDFQETWKFLDRRLQDVAFVGRTVSEVSIRLEVKHSSCLTYAVFSNVVGE